MERGKLPMQWEHRLTEVTLGQQKVEHALLSLTKNQETLVPALQDLQDSVHAIRRAVCAGEAGATEADRGSQRGCMSVFGADSTSPPGVTMVRSGSAGVLRVSQATMGCASQGVDACLDEEVVDIDGRAGSGSKSGTTSEVSLGSAFTDRGSGHGALRLHAAHSPGIAMSPMWSNRSNDVVELRLNSMSTRMNALSTDAAMDRPSTFISAALPPNWPATLEIRDFVRMASTEAPNGSLGVLTRTPTGKSALWLTTSEQESVTKKASRWVLDPSSNRHLFFDMMSLVVLFHDLTVIPFVLAWGTETTGTLTLLSVISGSFWTLDIMRSFHTGYYSKGVLVSKLSKIRRHYLHTWFWPDFIVVVSDWVSMAITWLVDDDTAAGGIKMLRLAKLGRLLRIISMLRMLRFLRVLEELVEGNMSETYRLLLQILRISCGVLWFTHLLACSWYAIGRLADTDTGVRWLDHETVIGDVLVSYRDSRELYQYITSFHWCASQITLGSISIEATNSGERAFNIVALLIGLLFGSTLISSLSASMVDYGMTQKDHRDKLKRLRLFLREYSIERVLALRVTQQITERMNSKARLHYKDVAVLDMLSSGLRMQLKYAMFREHACTLHLFGVWDMVDAAAVQCLCSEGLDNWFLRASDDLFVAATHAGGAYYLVNGKFTYTQDPETSPVDVPRQTTLHDGQWVSEAALSMDWIHVGTSVATTWAEVLQVDAMQVWMCSRKNYVLKDITLQYIRRFHQAVVHCLPPHQVYPSDVYVPHAEFGELMTNMSRDTMLLISNHVLDYVESLWGWQYHRAHHHLHKLRDEISLGKSCVVYQGHGEVQRICPVVALRIKRSDDMFLCQIATRDAPSLRPVARLQLPGRKYRRDEPLKQVVTSVIQLKLAPFSSCLKVESLSREDVESDSLRMGVKTKYLRTVCDAAFTKPFVAPMVDMASARTNASSISLSTARNYRNVRRSRSTMGSNSSMLKDDELEERLMLLMQKDVWVFPHKGLDGKVIFYTFVSSQEYAFLCTAGGESVLDQFVARLPANEKFVECDGADIENVLQLNSEAPAETSEAAAPSLSRESTSKFDI